MDQCAALISTKHNHYSSLVEMTTRSKSGHTKQEDVYLHSMATLTTSEQSSSTMNYLGFSRPQMIKRSEFGTGRIDH